jgi:hypothetical protein
MAFRFHDTRKYSTFASWRQGGQVPFGGGCSCLGCGCMVYLSRKGRTLSLSSIYPARFHPHSATIEVHPENIRKVMV